MKTFGTYKAHDDFILRLFMMANKTVYAIMTLIILFFAKGELMKRFESKKVNLAVEMVGLSTG